MLIFLSMGENYKGIWKNREIRKSFTGKSFISIDEGDVPTHKFKDLTKYGIEGECLVFREDLNPTGSWKDRGSAYLISKCLEQNINEIVISSTGNAAISLMRYANETKNIKINVVVSDKISEQKLLILKSLTNNRHEIHLENSPKIASSRIAYKKNAFLVRSSIDESVVKGYWSLGFEIFDKIKNNNKKNILLCSVSSGASFVGLTQGIFMKFEKVDKMPKLIALQTQKCHPLLDMFSQDHNEKKDTKSLVEAISNPSILRSSQILKAIRETDGQVFSITDQELIEAKNLASEIGLFDLSWASLMPFAGLMRLKKSNQTQKNYNYILITSGR